MGIPFLIHELTAEAGRRRVRAARPGGGLDVSVVRWVEDRIQSLSAEAVELFSIVATASQPLAVLDAIKAARLGAEARSALTDLYSLGLLRSRRSEKNEVEVYHDRLRRAWISTLPVAERRRLHGRLAVVLESSGNAGAERVFFHFHSAGWTEKSVEYGVQAAEQARKALAFGRAGRLYRTVLRIAPVDRRQALRIALAEVLADAGRGRESAEAYLSAVDGAGHAEEVLDLQWRAAEQQLKSGFYDVGLETMAAVLARMSLEIPRTPSAVLRKVVTGGLQLIFRGARREGDRQAKPSVDLLRKIDVLRSLTMGLANVNPMVATDCAIRQLRLALEAGEPRRLGRALALAAGFASTHAWGRSMADRLIGRAREVADGIDDDPALWGLVSIIEGLRAYLAGDGLRGLSCFRQAETRLRSCAGVAWELDTALFYELRLLLFLGRLNEIRSRLPGVVEECRGRNDLYAVSSLLTDVAATMALVDDDPDEHERLVTSVEESWSKTGFHLQHYLCLSGRVEAMIYRGDGELAWRTIEEAWGSIRRSTLLQVDLIHLQALNIRGRAALASARTAGPNARRARFASVRRSLRRMERIRHPWARPFAWIGRAALSDLGGRPHEAVDRLWAALPDLAEQGLEVHRRVAEARLAQLLDQPDRATRALAWMARREVQNPKRWIRLMSPGFEDFPAEGWGESSA